jgi:hypothetical protein
MIMVWFEDKIGLYLVLHFIIDDSPTKGCNLRGGHVCWGAENHGQATAGLYPGGQPRQLHPAAAAAAAAPGLFKGTRTAAYSR